MFDQNSSVSKRSLSTYLLYGMIALSPLFFIPSGFYSLDFAKNSFIIIGLIVVAILQLIGSFKEKKIEIMPKVFLISFGLLAVSILASALYSPTVMKSLFGQGFELNTASFLLALLLAVCVSYKNFVIDIKRSFTVYALIVSTYSLLFLYHFLRVIFGADFLDFGIFSSISSSPVGSLMDFGIFSAVIFLIGLISLRFLNLPRAIKLGVWIITIISAISVTLINIQSVWIALGIVLFGLCVYLYKNNKTQTYGILSGVKYKLPWVFAIVFVLVVLIGSQGEKFISKINDNLQIGFTDVGLSWRSTLDIAVGSIKASPIFGIGENRFVQAYTAFKPLAINQTDLWSIEFSRGFSWLGTFVATQGFFGLLTWILFFVILFRAGNRVFEANIEDPINKYISISSYTASAFLWIMFMIYTPGQVILFLASVFTGIFIASIVNAKIYEGKEYDFTNNKKIIYIALIIGFVFLSAWGIMALRKIVGMSYFGAGVKHMTVENSLVEADESFKNALISDSSNVYWQARAEVAMAMIRNLVSSINSQTSASTSAAIATEAGNLANLALTFSERAIELDPYNYYNYVSKARVAELATLLSMDKAKDVTIEAYKQAIALNGTNPEIYLNLSNFLASQKMYDEALEAVGISLNIKNNYIDAIYLLSQIQAEKGDLKNAIVSAKVATQINPNNPLLFFQLGLLEYSNSTYTGAVDAFEKALELNNDYANASYFLGLSYARVGKNAEAVAQFQKLSDSNPDNQEISEILASLIAGKDIFRSQEIVNATKSEKLPIEQ